MAQAIIVPDGGRVARGALCGLAMVLAALGARAAGVTPELQQRVRGATFEVVLKKPEHDPLSYEKPLPLELLPYIERTDAYRSIGTAFALGHNTYVTAGHVLAAGIASQYGAPALRGADGQVHAIERVLKYSAHEDFAVFSLADDPAPPPLEVNRTPRIDDPVLAVGNALGEGIVIRDGLFTSETPEEQDGRWKWIRFSAAASPGNSGGPLLDAAGRVIGIVIGKSPNENLNYSLPIGRVLDAAPGASFELRALQGLPFLRGTRTYTLRDAFALPQRWADFARAYVELMARHGDRARAELQAAYADTLFPRGKGVEDLLYDVDGAYFPRIIAQDNDERWSAEDWHYARTELGGDGFIGVATQRGITLLRLHRPDTAADAAWYGDSQAFMDMALKGLGLTRPVGSDAVRVTSLGPAISDTRVLDRYGRRWQERSWALPYLDAYVQALLLPTPDGYVGMAQVCSGLSLPETRKRLELLADLFDVSYWGSLRQWRVFLARREALPDALSAVRLAAVGSNGGWRLDTPRVAVTLAPALMAIDEHSMLGLQMAYAPDGQQAAWGIGALAWYQDEAEKTYVIVTRHLRPPGGASRELRQSWEDLLERRSPYSGTPTRDGANAWTVQSVIDAPGPRAGAAADELLYSLTVHTENRARFEEILDMQQRALQAVRVLEHGARERASATAPATAPVPAGGASPGAMTRELDRQLAGLDAIVAGLGDYGRQLGRDPRGREFADDLRDYVTPAERQARIQQLRDGIAAAEAAGRQGELTELAAEIGRLLWQRQQRLQALLAYWPRVPELRASESSWSAFLMRNHLPADTPQSAQVAELRGRLNAALQSEVAYEDIAVLVEQLQAAYLEERKALYARVRALQPGGAPPYRERSSACPAPVADSGGGTHPVRVNADRSIDEYYPAQSKRDGETGSVILSLRVDARGCALGVAVLVSSGFERLDAAALRWIEEAATFTPAAESGRPVAAVKELAVTFRLSAADFAPPGIAAGS